MHSFFMQTSLYLIIFEISHEISILFIVYSNCVFVNANDAIASAQSGLIHKKCIQFISLVNW